MVAVCLTLSMDVLDKKNVSSYTSVHRKDVHVRDLPEHCSCPWCSLGVPVPVFRSQIAMLVKVFPEYSSLLKRSRMGTLTHLAAGAQKWMVLGPKIKYKEEMTQMGQPIF